MQLMGANSLSEWASNQGPVVFILCAVIYFGFHYFKTFLQRLHNENKSAWSKADEEREKRFQDMRDRFASSDRRHEICEEDRARMQAQMVEILLSQEERKSSSFARGVLAERENQGQASGPIDLS
jgi:hypothetical protein